MISVKCFFCKSTRKIEEGCYVNVVGGSLFIVLNILKETAVDPLEPSLKARLMQLGSIIQKSIEQASASRSMSKVLNYLS